MRRLPALGILAWLVAAPASGAGEPPAGPPSPPAPAPAPGPAPRAEFDREAHDFGAAAQEQELRTEFRLTNRGDAPLEVRDLRADCGCAAATVDGTTLAPGEATTIRAVLRTLAAAGMLKKRVIVTTNDPVRPRVELGIAVDVAQGVVLAPSRFFFGDVLAGTKPSASLRVQWKDRVGRPFELVGVEASGLDLAFETSRFDKAPWHGWEITATFRTPPPVGNATGTVVLRTTDPDRPRLLAYVQAFVSGKVWVDRRSVSLGMVPAGRGRELAVIVRPFLPGVELGRVTATSRKGVLEVTPVPSGSDWVLTIRLPASRGPGRVEDVIEVRSSIPDEPPTEIAVTGTVVEAPP